MKNDPFYMQSQPDVSGEIASGNDTVLTSNPYHRKSLHDPNSLNTSSYSRPAYSDPNEAKVYKKLGELNAALNNALVPSNKTTSPADLSYNNRNSVSRADNNRLEQMMNMNKNTEGGEDPEMKQLSKMMDKIIDIQHPERVKDSVRQTSETKKGQVFAVIVNSDNNEPSLIRNDQTAAINKDTTKHKVLPENSFFSLDNEIENTMARQNAIQAVIHETQTLVEGAIVKLRLVNDVYVNGILIPKGNFVFGTASLNGERLNISINSIRYGNDLFPVQLSVVDMDGIEGVYIPGAITRDVAKQSADLAVQGIGLNTLDPSVRAQAATAGIEAAKNLLSKKAKLIKVTVKAGFQVLLRDEKKQQDN